MTNPNLDNDDLNLDSLLAEVRAKRPELYVSIAPKPTANYDVVRRRWLCVMHLLGASFGQLGRSLQRSAQTIHQSVDKEMPKALRTTSRLSLSLTHEALSWYTDQFYTNKTHLMTLQPQAAAKWLKENRAYVQGE